jgi:hypothetical protein
LSSLPSSPLRITYSFTILTLYPFFTPLSPVAGALPFQKASKVTAPPVAKGGCPQSLPFSAYALDLIPSLMMTLPPPPPPPTQQQPSLAAPAVAAPASQEPPSSSTTAAAEGGVLSPVAPAAQVPVAAQMPDPFRHLRVRCALSHLGWLGEVVQRTYN